MLWGWGGLGRRLAHTFRHPFVSLEVGGAHRAMAGVQLPGDVAIHIAAILRGQDIGTRSSLTVKTVRGLLEERLSLPGKSLNDHREKIRELMDAEMARLVESEA